MSVSVSTVSALRDECLASTASPTSGVIAHCIELDTATLGEWDLSGTPLTIDHRVIIRGNGAVIKSTTSDCIRLDHGSARSCLYDLRCQGHTGTPVNIGIRIHSHGVRLFNIDVQQFDGGIFVDSQASGENCNSPVFFACYVNTCTSYGLKTIGADSNAGCIVGIEFINCGNAIHEESFLGNAYFGCTMEGHNNTGDHGYYQNASANYTSLIACYIEGGDGLDINGSANPMAIAGNVPQHADFKAERFGRGRARAAFQSDAGDCEVSICGQETKALMFSHKEDRDAQSGAYYSLGYNTAWNMWFLGYQGGSAYALRWLGPESVSWTASNIDPAIGT